MTIGIVGNTAKPETLEVTKRLSSLLAKKGVSIVFHDDLAKAFQSSNLFPSKLKMTTAGDSDLAPASDLVVALGGDGTMLAAARIVGEQEIPILGINLGKLGFLAEVSVEEMPQCVDEILEGKYLVEDRMVLQAVAGTQSKKYFSLNEIVIDKGASARVIDLETYVNNDYLVTYTADGIMLTTPTGSTGYSLATGGPLVAPQSNVIVINPMAPHTLTARAVIVPDTSVIKIAVKAASKSVHIAADGQVEGFYDVPAEFEIRKANHTIKLVKRKKRTFYDLLRTKLMWGRDVRLGGKK
jgi:NAD+ kinase